MIGIKDLIQGGAKAPEGPLEHLQACHRRIEDRLATLERAGEALERCPAEAVDAILKSIEFFDRNGVWHTEDEEQSVFPRLLERLSADEAATLRRLEEEHERAEELHQRLKTLVTALPWAAEEFRGCVRELAALYRAHIEVEDSELMAAAQRVLTADELEAIGAEMKERRKP
ncbi:MAG: hemerythrin domain-containing protein [Bryobacteraceae bacterium]|nr:hemerythrin domain-containing protein [Bryobacteraceae bacterium]